MQEPIMTRWWTTGIAALSFRKYCDVYCALAKAVVNQSTTKMAENMIGSDIISLAREPVIRSDIEILATYAEVCFNEHFEWSQGTDPNVGTPGFLSYHQSSRYFIKARNLEEMVRSWRTQAEFEVFRKSVELIPAEATKERPINRDVQESKMDKFLGLANSQLKKHAAKLVTTNAIIFGALGEFPTSVIVARMILSGTHFQVDSPKLPSLTGLPAPFESTIHKKTINYQDFAAFLVECCSTI
jgi:hypothetical protein